MGASSRNHACRMSGLTVPTSWIMRTCLRIVFGFPNWKTSLSCCRSSRRTTTKCSGSRKWEHSLIGLSITTTWMLNPCFYMGLAIYLFKGAVSLPGLSMKFLHGLFKLEFSLLCAVSVISWRMTTERYMCPQRGSQSTKTNCTGSGVQIIQNRFIGFGNNCFSDVIHFQRPGPICLSFLSSFKLPRLVEIVCNHCLGEPFFAQSNRTVVWSHRLRINGLFFGGFSRLLAS